MLACLPPVHSLAGLLASCPLSAARPLPPPPQVEDIVIIDQEGFDASTVWSEDMPAGVQLGQTTLAEALQKQGFLVVPATNIKSGQQERQGPRRELAASWGGGLGCVCVCVGSPERGGAGGGICIQQVAVTCSLVNAA